MTARGRRALALSLPLAALVAAAAAGCGRGQPAPASSSPPAAHRHTPRPWTVHDVFPHLRFQNPTCAVMPPRQKAAWFVGEREGRVLRVANHPDVRDKTVVLDLRSHTLGWQDVGLLNLVFHPEFGSPGSPNRGHFYLWYNHVPDPHPGPDHPFHGQQSWTRLSRFTIPDGSTAADPRSELVLIEQRRTNTDHMGGGMFFHPGDGMLYLAVGDGGTDYRDDDDGQGFSLVKTADPQRIDGELLSGVLRIDVDRRPGAASHPIRRRPHHGRTDHYAIPSSNPWIDPRGGVLEEFFAIGFRNPHRMSVDPPTGRIFLADVGETSAEEINLVVAGGNYGWGFREGHQRKRRDPRRLIGVEQRPIHTYRGGYHSAVIGGHVYRGQAYPDLAGQYLFGDNGTGQIWALDPARGGEPAEMMRLPGEMLAYAGLSSFAEDAEHEPYLCILGDNQRATGSLQKLVPLPAAGDGAPGAAATLSATGLFTSTASLSPAPGLFGYEINHAFWSDGAHKRRWLAVPDGSRLGFRATGDWTFPPGTVAVKHFDLALDERDPTRLRRLETRVLALDRQGRIAGRTFRWRPDGQDADLVDTSAREFLTAISAAPFGPFTAAFSGAPGGGHLAPDREGGLRLTVADGGRGGLLFASVAEEGDHDVAARWAAPAGEATGLMLQGRGPAGEEEQASLGWQAGGLFRGARLVIETGRRGRLTRKVIGDGSAGPWLRLVRSGARLRFFASSDGVLWRLLGEAEGPDGPARVGPFLRGAGSAAVTGLQRCLVRDHHYPEPGECATCHIAAAGHFLGISTRQWNRQVPGPAGAGENQLLLASRRGLLDGPPAGVAVESLDRLVPIADATASTEERFRSYLDANCSFCHRPGVVAQVGFDARRDTPLDHQGLIGGRRRWPSVPRPRDFIVVPGDHERSELFKRLARRSMPPVGGAVPDQAGIQLVRDWIDGLN